MKKYIFPSRFEEVLTVDENKKQINSNRIIILLLAVLLVVSAIKIGALTDDVKNSKVKILTLIQKYKC